MPVESAKQFELTTLEELLRGRERPEIFFSSLWYAVFGTLGVLLLIVVYYLHYEKLLSPYWLYFLCFLSGVCLGGAGIVNRLNKQSKIAVKYIDKAAVVKRIKELKM